MDARQLRGLPIRPLLPDVFGRLHGGAEEGIGRDAQMQALLVRDLHQLLALPEVDGDHLLTEHVLARQQRLLDDGIVGCRGVVRQMTISISGSAQISSRLMALIPNFAALAFIRSTIRSLHATSSMTVNFPFVRFVM